MSWNTIGMILGVIAVIYGLLVAFGARTLTAERKRRVVLGGAGFIILLAVLLSFFKLAGAV